MLQSSLFSVILIKMFLRFTYFMIVVYIATPGYGNVNKSIPRLFVRVSVTVQSLSRVCKLKTKYKLHDHFSVSIVDKMWLE